MAGNRLAVLAFRVPFYFHWDFLGGLWYTTKGMLHVELAFFLCAFGGACVRDASLLEVILRILVR